MKEQISEIVIKAAKEIGEEIESKELINAKLSTKLYGQNGNLDSLRLVRLIGEIEELLSDNLNVDITITSEKAMSRKNSPFSSVETLTEYILEVIKEN